MRTFFSLCLVLLSTDMYAQSTFITHLERREQNCGIVTVSQTKEIENLVNGIATISTSSAANTSSATTTSKPAVTFSEETQTETTRKIKTSGYRIQVYSGGNSRDARSNAYAAADKVKRMFPGMNVYTHFASPRWICRAGDFKTYEEANDILQQMRESGLFTGISIVKDQIVLAL